MSGSQFRQAHLYGESATGSTPDAVVHGEYDLMFLVSSWDARCIAITESHSVTAKRAVTVFFDLKDNLGLRDLHDPRIRQFALSRSRQQIPITGNSVDIATLWNRLSDALQEAYRAKQRPLKLLIDISTCPRVYTAAILGAAFGRGIAAEITMFYSQGEYANGQGLVPEAFTAGRWRIVTVPGLAGLTDPGKRRFYLISVGFEGSKTYQAVSEADPSRISLLFPDPGYSVDYTKRAWHVNEPLIRDYCIPPEQIVRAPAGDAIAAWRELATAPKERPDEENTFYICCGTKPHAVALALRAMALRFPAVLYYVPGEHRVVATRSSGIFWSYTIRDLTAIP